MGSPSLESGGGVREPDRDEPYETHCPVCFEVVVFAPMRDRNNLMCPHCSNLFDAKVANRQAEVLGVISIQKHARGAFARRFTRQLARVKVQKEEAARVAGVAAEEGLRLNRHSIEEVATDHVMTVRRASLQRSQSPSTARPEAYVTSCPACFSAVHFSLMLDSNNLMCATCDNLFDATVSHKQAEVLAALSIQKHVRGRMERLRRKFAQQLLTMHQRYNAACPVCGCALAFVPHRSDTVMCPHCTSVFAGAKAVRLVRTEVVASVRIQRHVRGRLARVRARRARFEGTERVLLVARKGLRASRNSVEEVAADYVLAHRRALSPTLVRPETYVASCPACFAAVQFSRMREASSHLVCTGCDNMFDATVAFRQVEVIAAIRLQKHVRERNERRMREFGEKLLEMGRRYRTACPVCLLSITFTPHHSDTVVCPHCANVFGAASAMRVVSSDVLATIRIQQHARGTLERTRLRRLRAPVPHSVRLPAEAEAEAESEAEAEAEAETESELGGSHAGGSRKESLTEITISRVRAARAERSLSLSPGPGSARPEAYVTSCPACFSAVHFSLVLDSNNLMCGTCDNLFDATVSHKQAEVLAALSIQKHVRLERLRRKFAQQLLTMHQRYNAACPVCGCALAFVPHRSDTVMCPHCTSVFAGAKAVRLVRTEVVATVRIQRHTRGALQRARSRPHVLAAAEHAVEDAQPPAPTPKPAEPAPVQQHPPPPPPPPPATPRPHVHWAPHPELPGRVLRPEQWATACPSCSGQVRFGLVRDTRHLLCPHCSCLFDATQAHLEAEVVAAIHIQKLARGRLGRRQRQLVDALMPHVEYRMACPTCYSLFSFTPHRGADTGVCPHCANVFAAASLRSHALPVIASMRLQRHARGYLVRKRMRASAGGPASPQAQAAVVAEARVEAEAEAKAEIEAEAEAEAEMAEEAVEEKAEAEAEEEFEADSEEAKPQPEPQPQEPEPQEPPPPPPQPAKPKAAALRVATRCPHCGLTAHFSGPADGPEPDSGAASLVCHNCLRPFALSAVQAQAEAALRIQRHARGRLARKRTLSPVALLMRSLSTPLQGELNRTRCPSCRLVVSFRPHGSSDLTVCPGCSHFFSAEAAMREAVHKAVLDVQRWVRGRLIRTMTKRLRRSMRPSQLVRARSAFGSSDRLRQPQLEPQPEPQPQAPAQAQRSEPAAAPLEMAAAAWPSADGQLLSAGRRNMARPSSARALPRQSAQLQAEQEQARIAAEGGLPTPVPRRRPGSSPARRAPRPRPLAPASSEHHLPLAAPHAKQSAMSAEQLHALVQEMPQELRRRVWSSDRLGDTLPQAGAWRRTNGRSSERLDRLGATLPAPLRSPSPRDVKQGRMRMELIAQIYGISYTRGPNNSLQLEKTSLPKYYA